MYSFSVLASSDIASDAGIEIVFRSFANFHHDLTPKHKKKSKLIFIDKGGYALTAIQWAEQLEIKTHVQVLNWKRIDAIREAYAEATLFLLPSRSEIEEIIVQALSKGIPILSYKEEVQMHYIDHTCGTLIDYYSKEQSIEDFANVMRMLYFDPEACKMLKKGALTKHTNQVNWEQTPKKLSPSSIVS